MEKEGEDEVDEGEEPIDENDPLWKAAFKIAGNRAATLKLLEDPDELMKYPEVMAIMNATSSGDEETNSKSDGILEASMEELTLKLSAVAMESSTSSSSSSAAATAAAAASAVDGEAVCYSVN